MELEEGGGIEEGRGQDHPHQDQANPPRSSEGHEQQLFVNFPLKPEADDIGPELVEERPKVDQEMKSPLEDYDIIVPTNAQAYSSLSEEDIAASEEEEEDSSGTHSAFFFLSVFTSGQIFIFNKMNVAVLI